MHDGPSFITKVKPRFVLACQPCRRGETGRLVVEVAAAGEVEIVRLALLWKALPWLPCWGFETAMTKRPLFFSLKWIHFNSTTCQSMYLSPQQDAYHSRRLVGRMDKTKNGETVTFCYQSYRIEPNCRNR